MKFSIIIPVYNAQQYLRQCIDSVLVQTYPEYEIILVNDGSDDASGQICDKYRGKHPDRIHVIHSENRGALIARTTGIRHASGDVLLFLDSDDLFRSDTLRILHRAFESSGCDLILFNGSLSEGFDAPFRAYPFANGTLFDTSAKEPLYRTLTSSSLLNNVCLKAAKRHLFQFDMHLDDLPLIRHGEDLLMSVYLLDAAEKVLFLNENLCFYRQREGSIVHSFHPNRAESIKTVHQVMERFIDAWALPELHPAHYAKEVHGWIETLLILLDNKSRLTPAAFRQQLSDLATDPYFLRAYKSMDTKALSPKYRQLARWLYKKNYFLLHLTGILKKAKNKIQNRH